MQMTEEEIVKKYKENRNKKGYTNILAQLNCCTKQDINDILRKHGVDLPGNPNFGKPKATLKKEEPATTEEPVVIDTTDKTLDKSCPITKDESNDNNESSTNTSIHIPDSIKELIKNYLNDLIKQRDELDRNIKEITEFINKCN